MSKTQILPNLTSLMSDSTSFCRLIFLAVFILCVDPRRCILLISWSYTSTSTLHIVLFPIFQITPLLHPTILPIVLEGMVNTQISLCPNLWDRVYWIKIFPFWVESGKHQMETILYYLVSNSSLTFISVSVLTCISLIFDPPLPITSLTQSWETWLTAQHVLKWPDSP